MSSLGVWESRSRFIAEYDEDIRKKDYLSMIDQGIEQLKKGLGKDHELIEEKTSNNKNIDEKGKSE